MRLCSAFLSLLFLISLSSCKQQYNKDIQESGATIKPAADTTLVPVVKLRHTTFNDQTWSNGILEASEKVEVVFQAQGMITDLYVRNGQKVQAGCVLAQLENNRQRFDLAQAQIAYNKALIELEDLLLRLHHSLNDTAAIPPAIWSMAKLQSGFDQAKLQLAHAQHNLSQTTVRAPIGGVVTGLEVQKHFMANTGKILCTLINNRVMVAVFSLLESEIQRVNQNMPVRIMPLAYPKEEFAGAVISPEPVIDKNGHMKVRASISNADGRLMDGMTLRVVIESGIENQLVVPKTAVLARQGRQVVFTVENGHAVWNYVVTGKENTTEYTILEGLSEGQTVITGNNLTIGHLAPVKLLQGS